MKRLPLPLPLNILSLKRESTMKFKSNSHCILLLLFFFTSVSFCRGRAADGPQVPGMFVFGSSLVDNGNNHFLEGATSRADYFPYGMDSTPGACGRYSNGKNVIDGLTDLLHLPPLPPFLDPNTKGLEIIHGVNFASGGSGILDDTGSTSGRVINMNQQITNFETVTLADLSTKLNCSCKDSLTFALSKYLFIIGVGGNDYMFNYFPRNSSKPNLEAFTSQLIASLSIEHIQRLYNLGARKFILISLYPFGCIPYVKDPLSKEKGCLNTLNKAALLYNSKLRYLVDTLKQQMPGSSPVYVDSYQVITDIINNPTSKGFKDTSNSCCKVSPKKDGSKGVRCDKGGPVCADRRSHVFFDSLHPTEAVNLLIAKKGYSSKVSNEVYPFNIQELAKLDTQSQSQYVCMYMDT